MLKHCSARQAQAANQTLIALPAPPYVSNRVELSLGSRALAAATCLASLAPYEVVVQGRIHSASGNTTPGRSIAMRNRGEPVEWSARASPPRQHNRVFRN